MSKSPPTLRPTDDNCFYQGCVKASVGENNSGQYCDGDVDSLCVEAPPTCEICLFSGHDARETLDAIWLHHTHRQRSQPPW